MSSIQHPSTQNKTSDASSPAQGAPAAAEQREDPQGIRGYFDTPRCLRVACSKLEVGINEMRLAWFICDETFGWHSRWVALTQKDIIEGVSWRQVNHKGSGIPHKSAVTETVQRCLKLRLIEVQYSGSVTLYAIHRRFWQTSLTPIWYIYNNKVHYDAALEPALPEEQAVISRVTGGEEMPEPASNNKPVIDRLPGSYLQRNSQLSTGYQAVISRVTETTAGASPGAAPRAPNKASQESSSNKDFQESITCSPNGSHIRVEIKEEVEEAETREDASQVTGRKDGLKGNQHSNTPAVQPRASDDSISRPAPATTEQQRSLPTGTEETKAPFLPSKTKARVTARERTDSPKAITQAADRAEPALEELELALEQAQDLLRKGNIQQAKNVKQLKKKIAALNKQRMPPEAIVRAIDGTVLDLKVLQAELAGLTQVRKSLEAARLGLKDKLEQAEQGHGLIGEARRNLESNHKAWRECQEEIDRLKSDINQYDWLVAHGEYELPQVETDPTETLALVASTVLSAEMGPTRPECETTPIAELDPKPAGAEVAWPAEDTAEVSLPAVTELEHTLEDLQARFDTARDQMQTLVDTERKLQQKKLSLSGGDPEAIRRDIWENMDAQATKSREQKHLEAEQQQVALLLLKARHQQPVLVH